VFFSITSCNALAVRYEGIISVQNDLVLLVLFLVFYDVLQPIMRFSHRKNSTVIQHLPQGQVLNTAIAVSSCYK